jgi:hypothetical protein
MEFLDCELFSGGFSVIDPLRGKSPKVKIGPGPRFFTDKKFGDLEILGRVFLETRDLQAAVEESGVSRRRARRFLISINLMDPTKRKKKTFKYKKDEFVECDICGKQLKKGTPRQKRHTGQCYYVNKLMTNFKYR